MEILLDNRSKMVIDYLNSHPGLFSEFERDIIINEAKLVKGSKLLPGFVREVFDEVGVIRDDKNIYLGFIKLLDDTFDIKDKGIIEVGGGIIPRLGKRISLMQGKGSITVYDPRLSVYEKSSDNMILVRKKFGMDTDVKNCDLMIGFMPCKAAEVIINSAIEHDKDFMVALCEGGPHGDEFDYFEDDEEWRNCVVTCAMRDVEDAGMGKLKIKYLEKYNNPYPIIYNQRKD